MALAMACLLYSPCLQAAAGDTPGNFLLFFRETDPVALGANDNLTIDLGSVTANAGGFSYDFSEASSIVSQTYGNNWFARDSLFWGIMGFTSYSDLPGDDLNNMKLSISRELASSALGQMTGVSLYDLAQKWPDVILNVTSSYKNAGNISGTGLTYSIFEKGQKAWSDMQEDPAGAFAGALGYTANSDHPISLNSQFLLSQYTPDLSDFGNVALSTDLLSLSFTNGILSATSISGGGGGIYSGPWNWTAGSGNWSMTGNWTNNQVASNGVAVGITGAGGMITNDSVTSLSSLTFSNTAGSYTLTGTNDTQTLTISAGITNNSAAIQTIDLSIAGAGGVTLSGSGTTVLARSNSYSGGTTLSSGAVVVGNNNALGNGAVTVSGASSLIAGVANLSTTNAMAFNASTTIDTAANRWTNAGVLSGSGSLTKIGSGTLTIAGTGSTFSGNTALNAGAMQVATGSTLGSGTVKVASGASLSGSGTVGGITVASGGVVMAGSDTAIGTLNVTGNGIWNGGGIYNWKISDASGSEGVGYDSISIGGSLDLSEVTSVNKFQINLWSLGGNAANFNKDVDTSWKIASFSSLNGGFSTNLFSVNLGATNGTGGFLNVTNGAFSLSSSANALFLQYKTLAVTDTSGIWSAGSGNLSGITNGSLLQFTGVGGSLTNQSVTNLTGISYGALAGSYTLSGTNLTLSGNVTNASSSQQNISSRMNLGTNVAIMAQNGAMQLTGAVALNSNNLTISGDRQTTLAGDIAGSGTLIKQGSGSLVLTGVSSNPGGLAVESGRVLLSGGDDRLSSEGRLSVTSGAIVDLGTTSQRLVALSGSGTITGGSGSITFAPSNAISYAGTIGGQKAVVQNGLGTTTLTGSNSYTGGTIVSAGTLVAGSSNALGATLSPISVRGGTLDLGGESRTMGSVTLAAGEISNGSFTATNLMASVASGQQATISATLAGKGGFWKLGAGTLNLLSAMPNGTNIISAGTLKTFGSVTGVASNALGKIIVGGSATPSIWSNEGNMTLATNGKTILELRDAATLRTGDLTLAAAKSSQGTLLLTGTGTNGGTTLDVGSGTISFGAGAGKIEYQKSSSFTLSQALSGKGMLTVSGKGTLTLAGNNSGFAGTNYLTSGGMVIAANTTNGGTAFVSGKKSTLTLQQGASLSNTNALHAVAGKLIDNSGLALTNSIRSSRIVTNGALRPGIILATGGTLEKSYAATNETTKNVAGFGAGYGSGKSFQILSGAVAGASTLTALSDANGRLDFHGTGSNPFVMAMTDASFTSTRNQIQWLDTNSATPFWTNTIAGNAGNTTNAAISGMNGLSFAGSFNSFLLQTSLKNAGITDAISDSLVELNLLGTERITSVLNDIMGAYGYDSATKTAWAVINHNSLFDSQPGIDMDLGLEPLDPGVSTVTTQAVPEPGTWALMVLGVGALLHAARAKRRKRI
jgi:autotransporter-associated beta strand protein